MSENKNLPVLKKTTDPAQRGVEIALLRSTLQPAMNKIFQFIDLTSTKQISKRDQEFGLYTLERIVKTLDKAPPISSINLVEPEECHQWLKQMFKNFCFDLDFEKSLTPGNIEELISFVKTKYYFFTFSDIHVMLDMAKRGELYTEEEQYGKTVKKKIVFTTQLPSWLCMIFLKPMIFKDVH